VVENNSSKHKLTKFMLWPASETVQYKAIPLPASMGDVEAAKYKYMLGIFAPAKEFLKITSYYLNSKDVMKITFVFDAIDDDIVRKVSLVIKDISSPPIHVSGFCMKNSKYIYEIYIPGKQADASKIVSLVKQHAVGFESSIEEIPVTSIPVSQKK
jgi:hypothetical protein